MLPDMISFKRGRFTLWALVGALLLATTMGVSCDQNAQADFRQSATQAIGDGLKTITTGLIDGWVSAVLNAGDGSTTSTTQ